MASRVMHLAITNELIQQYEFQDVERLRFGTVIPDGVPNREEYMSSHFKMTIGDEGERTYDLTSFRKQFSNRMKTDDLYLGYYLHLIQDLLYRHFVYDRYHWDPRPEGHLERLYDDYRQINARLINRYEMQKDMRIPQGFAAEPINEVAVFTPDQFMEEYVKDFQPIAYKERFFFTDEMADEYIQWAVAFCKKELDAVKNGTYYFDEYEWSWGK